jgi:hypothetical protein
MGLLNTKALSEQLGGYTKFSKSLTQKNEVRFVVRVDGIFYSAYTQNRAN